MRVNNMINFDGDLLKKELKKRGVNLKEASLAIGKSEKYLAVTINTSSRIPETSAIALEKVYGIKKEDIIHTTKQEEPQEQKFDYNKLYEVIYTAVYHACKKATEDAWKEA